MALTNKEKWDSYTSGLAAPQIYLDWCWLYTVGAALERRVWLPPAHAPIYGNKFVILVGKSGLGKGGGIRAASSLLIEHKRADHKKDFTNVNLTAEQKQIFAEMERREIEKAQAAHEDTGRNGSMDKAHLFPRAADSTTYESLVRCLAQSSRKTTVIGKDSEGKPTMDAISNCAMYFTLEELGSLMRRHTHDLVNLLLQCYDCSECYEYITKTQGKDRILRVCLNFLAGTTPHFLSNVFDTSILDEGFASRTFFVFAAKDRKTVWSIPQLSTEEKKAREEISAHIKSLKNLYGEVRVDQSTIDKLASWFHDIRNDTSKRASRSEKLDPFYNRSNLHIQKIAMAMHFSESQEMYIPLSTFERAIEFLETTTKTSHMALMVNEKNPEAQTAARIVQLLHLGEKEWRTIYAEMYRFAKGSKKEIEDALAFLMETDQVVSERKEHPVTKETVMFFRIKDR